MIDLSRITTCFAGLVGFRNSDRTCISDFSNSQTGATSTVYVTDEPAITPTNITAAMPKDFTILSDYVSTRIRKATQDTVQEFINKHKELTGARTLVEISDVVKGNNIFTNQITKSGRFVGIIIEPHQSDTLAAVLKYVGVQFNTINTSLTLYLYDTSQNDAIATMVLSTHNKALSLQWIESTMVARYRSNDGGTGQRFLLGYYENDLIGNAVSTSMANCTSGCHGYEWVSQYQKHVYVTGVSIPASGLNGILLPNTQMIGEGDETYGLHLRFYVTCELSDIVCDNKDMFALAASKRCAMAFYRDFQNNSNHSAEADLVRDRAETNYAMAKEEFDGLLRSIKIDFTNLDNLCLPCSQKSIQTKYIS